jgi:hypothetical protein
MLFDVMGMLMVVHFEFDPMDMDVVLEKVDKIREIIKENPDDFPKFVTPDYIYNGETKGFAVIEIERPEQLMNIARYYMPEKKYTCKQVIEGKIAREIWKKQFT